jgi:hypothetical protein
VFLNMSLYAPGSRACTPMTLPPYFRLQGLALFAAAFALPSMAVHAQTYTYRALSFPAGAHGCFAERNVGQVLNDKGEVAGKCDYFTGYVWQYGDFIPTLLSTYGNVKSFAWSATGVPRTLSVPTGFASRSGISIDNTSKVRGLAVNTATPSAPPQMLVWQGTQTSVWAPPPAYPGSWNVNWVSPGGKVLALGADKIGIFADTGATLVPLPPVAAVATRNYELAAVNDAGQVAYYFDDINPSTSKNGQLWTWRSGGWANIAGPNVFTTYPQPRVEVSTTGQVLASTSGLSIYYSQDLLWRDGQAQSLPVIIDPHAFTALAPTTGDVVGWLPNNSGDPKATLWRNGVAIDLNAQVKLPSGWVLKKALDINSRGQILVSTGLRLVVLTPK